MCVTLQHLTDRLITLLALNSFVTSIWTSLIVFLYCAIGTYDVCCSGGCSFCNLFTLEFDFLFVWFLFYGLKSLHVEIGGKDFFYGLQSLHVAICDGDFFYGLQSLHV